MPSASPSGCGGGLLGRRVLLDQQGQFGAGRYRPAGVWLQVARNRGRVETGVAPVVEADQLRQQFCAQAMPVTGDGINSEMAGQRLLRLGAALGSAAG
jgi:hypothetical protein